MPIQHIPSIAMCEWDPTIVTELHPTDDLDEDYEDIDPQLPPGWTKIVASRLAVNPERAAEKDEFEYALRAQVEQWKEQKVPAKEIKKAIVGLRENFDPKTPEWIVETIEAVYSPDFADNLQVHARLPAWSTAE